MTRRMRFETIHVLKRVAVLLSRTGLALFRYRVARARGRSDTRNGQK
jgi:hypothetical protein